MEYFEFQENGRSGDSCQHFLVKATSNTAAYTHMSAKEQLVSDSKYLHAVERTGACCAIRGYTW